MKANLTNYRHIYEKVYGVTISKGFEIHHIDFNHFNNNPANLVMLPKELHTNLHRVYNEFHKFTDLYNLNDITIFSGCANSKSYFMSCLTEYVEILNQCVVWLNKRDFAKMIKENKEREF